MNDFEKIFEKVIKNPKKILSEIKENYKQNELSL